MATINTAIRLNDMMSAPIRHIINAMDGMLSTWNELESSTRRGLNVKGVESVRANLKLASQSLEDMKNEQEKFNRLVDNGSNAMDGLVGKIMGAVGAYVGIQKLVNLSDDYIQTQARLSTIAENGDVEALFDKITASANRSRASISATADMVAKLRIRAGDAFTSNDETVLFAETLNKMFAIAGTSRSEMASASLQLTQALGSGVLRGEEFNAIFEAAPNIMQTVADYMGKPIGQLRQMAADGEITAAVVKNALLSTATEVDEQFKDMPMTWAQVWTGIMNGLYYASIPLLEAINWMAQNWSVLQPIVLGVAAAVGLYTAALLINKGIQTASAIATTVKTIASIAHGAAITAEMVATTGMTKAQLAFNAALYACPLTWVILIIIAVITIIYAVVAAINKCRKTSISAIGVITGALSVAAAFVGNLFVSLINQTLDVFAVLWNFIAAFANFFANVLTDPVGAVARLFFDLVDCVLGLLQTLAGGIDALFGTNLAGAVQGWRDSLGSWVDDTFGKGVEVVPKVDASGMHLDRFEYGNAWDAGYNWGEGVEDSIGGAFGGGLTDSYSMDKLIGSMGEVPAIGDIAANTGDTADALDVTNENLKYMRDLAEQDAINRFTTAEIRVEMTNNNSISSNMDLDGVVDYMVIGVQEALERTAEGVHA